MLLVEGDDLPPFWARRTADALHLFFAHPGPACVVCYPMQYGQSRDWLGRPPDGVAIDLDGDRLPLDLDFGPHGQSLFVRVTAAGGASGSSTSDDRPPTPTDAPGV